MGRQDADMLREKDVVGDNWPSWGVGFGRRPFRPQPLSRAAANKIGGDGRPTVSSPEISEFRAEAFQAAVAKARELGWIK